MRRYFILRETTALLLGFPAFISLLLCSFKGLAVADNSQCLMCHSARSLSKTAEGKQVSLFVDAEIIRSSSHKTLLCTDCHADLRGAKIPHSPNVAAVSCTRCHGKKSVDGVRDFILMCQFAESVHAQGASQSKQKTVSCRDCHGTHDIRPAHDPHSMVSRANIIATCSKCHLDPHVAAIHKQLDIKKIKQYMSSVHGKLNKSHGFLPAAVCTDCHGAHEIIASDNPRSLVNRANVSETCGKCHIKQLKAYNQSIHGEAITNGKLEVATCTDCHGTHLILSISDPSSMVFPTNVRVTCSNCHENPKIQRKYGIPTNRLSSYDASYHGIANRYGDVLVANCASCHGAHEIRQSNDPLSATNKKNLPKTCAKCHQNISPNFAKGNIHLEPSPKKDIAVFWVGTAYQVFVTLIMLAFCGYIMLDLLAHLRSKKGGSG